MADFQQGPKQMFQGDWKCAKCGKDIKELPFEPRNTATLKCRDCWKAEKDAAQ